MDWTHCGRMRVGGTYLYIQCVKKIFIPVEIDGFRDKKKLHLSPNFTP